MFRIVIFLVSCFFVLHTHAQNQDSLRGGLSFERTCFDVTYYNLDLSIDIPAKYIKGYNDIFFTVLAPTFKMQLDLFSNLIIDSVFLAKQKITFTRDGNVFYVSFDKELQRDSSYRLRVYYEGNPIVAKNPPWDGGWVFSQDSLKRPWIGVACEGIGASLWWPLKDHLSDEPDSMRTHFTVSSDLTAIGNGVLESITNNETTKTYHWKVNYPINSYNVTCNIAYYKHIADTFIQKNTDTLAIDYYILDYNYKKAFNHFKQVKPMLTCYENYFGSYPFLKDGYALVETPYWGMEHQGAIAYGNDYTNKIIDFDYIIIHESAHEWWGNNISVKDHAEMWIHESFTTYAENLLVEFFYGYDMSVRYLNLNKSLIKNESPIVGPLGVNYDDWKDSDMYYKGAWILHTFRNVLNNDSLWFSILKEMQVDLAYQTIETADVVNYINKKTNVDYTWFFTQYLYQAKPPILEYSIVKHRNKITVWYKWQNTSQDFHMSIPIEILGSKISYITPTKEFQGIELKKKEYKKNVFVLNKNYYLLSPQKITLRKNKI